jgi:K+/H+ antiporter YhaU regulatory subunit KhtT
MLQSLPDPIRKMPIATHQIEESHWAVGRTVADVNLRATTGASILAIQRRERYLTSLSPDERIEQGDVMYLMGDESDVLLARQHLTQGAIQ